MGLVDGYHVWILPEMNLNDVRRAAERYDTCDVCALFKNVLMVGQKYAGIDTSYHLKVHSYTSWSIYSSNAYFLIGSSH